MRIYDYTSRVEEHALEKSGKPSCYSPAEKIAIVEVPDFPSLGKLTALRFLEWLQLNPEGVISLPTGKTPEHFVKWTLYFLQRWNQAEVQRELAEWGLDPARTPEMKSFSFVQIDEFYPINPAHENSFAYYINRFYFKGFGLDPQRALLMDIWKTGAPAGHDLGWVFPDGKADLSLRFRHPVNEMERMQYQAITAADQSAMEYEARIREWGGIGFFLGGIGPDGHIGFNIKGSDHFSTTRLIPINYETAAAAATDLGGIEMSRDNVVCSIGLKTITMNATTTALIIAAGDSKAKVVKDAVEQEASVRYPATALQALPGARFYLTEGAAHLLVERRYQKLHALPTIPSVSLERILIDIASEKRKSLVELTTADLAESRLGNLLLEKNVDVPHLTYKINSALQQRISKGLENVSGLTFLHTAPHHDDIMLGYLPYIIHLVRNPQNTHHFLTLTSGFTSVTNAYTLSLLRNLEKALVKGTLDSLMGEGYFSPDDVVSRNRDIYQYLDGVSANSIAMQKEAEARRMLRDLIELTETKDIEVLRAEIAKLESYFASGHPGKKDIPFVQKLKGMIREWEEELLWAHFGFNCNHISHLRLGFYTGDIFTPQLEWERDVQPVLDLLRSVKPDVVTVALDPEGSGPDTHYKVLQAVAEALRAYRKERPDHALRVWGYRNVWYRFHPSEADIFVPVSMNSLAIMQSAFHTCFGSQRSASFPSYEYDGPFCDLAQKIIVEQYATIKTCLGRDSFYASNVPRLRATRGLMFIRSMSLEEFFDETRSLKRRTECPS
ncbi:MAG: glucosamine-6-phosphate deaminase [Candidatus Latescibacterota bacterium]|nr:MAG: glucosamine-6-phosphate deaminase [Candidatus Latescibacterota bacterium]